jgi:uncharacterized membrane protein YgaE (UPF0421/DUF939 family)
VSLEEKGPLLLNLLLAILMIAAVMNIVVIKQTDVTNFLWAALDVWVGLLFAYLIFKVVCGRRRAKLFRHYHQRAADVLGIWN